MDKESSRNSRDDDANLSQENMDSEHNYIPTVESLHAGGRASELGSINQVPGNRDADSEAGAGSNLAQALEERA